MPLPAALQCRLAKRGLLKHVEPGKRGWGGKGGEPRGSGGVASEWWAWPIGNESGDEVKPRGGEAWVVGVACG